MVLDSNALESLLISCQMPLSANRANPNNGVYCHAILFGEGPIKCDLLTSRVAIYSPLFRLDGVVFTVESYSHSRHFVDHPIGSVANQKPCVPSWYVTTEAYHLCFWLRLQGYLPFVRMKQLGWPLCNGKGFSKISKQPHEKALTVCNSISRICFRLIREWKLGHLQNSKEISVVPFRTEKRITSGGSLQFPNGFSRKKIVPFNFQSKFPDFLPSVQVTNLIWLRYRGHLAEFGFGKHLIVPC